MKKQGQGPVEFLGAVKKDNGSTAKIAEVLSKSMYRHKLLLLYSSKIKSLESRCMSLTMEPLKCYGHQL